MNSSPVRYLRPVCTARTAVALAGFLVSATGLSAQAPAAGEDGGRRRRPDDAAGAERRQMSPQDMQARMLTAIRERLEITDDEEWKLISERIAKVQELRRTSGAVGGPAGAMMFGGRGPGGPGGGPGGPGSTGAPQGGPPGRGGIRPGGGSPEVAALSTALREKLPDAEIKARLDRVRELRKANEAQLTKAQEELRAVLTVRQEAMAVVFGLLP